MSALDATHSSSVLEDTMTATAARCLRVPVASLPMDVPLARLGLDSLGCMELASELETVLGRTVPLEAITASTTLRSLCAALDHDADVGPDPSTTIRADACLPDDIVPVRGRDAARLTDAKTILLTGATGFLGMSLLHALLTRTSAQILCLARSTQDDPRRRIDAVTPDGHGGRVEAVAADLSRPELDLNGATWAQLRERIDAVCHAGASINWISPYARLRDVNVLGTQTLLRLACESGASFHFVSSLSVCYSTIGPRVVDETFDSFPALDGLHFGYAQTKAVAEALVTQARDRGLRTSIHRPALISGDSRTGRFNEDDLLSALISGCVRMGLAPDLDWRLDAVPVDTVADAIVQISDGGGRTFHLAHPHPRHWRECVLWMRLYGYAVRLVPYGDWIGRLRHDSSLAVRHPLRALRPFFLDARVDGLTVPELQEERRRSDARSERTLQELQQSGLHVPPLDAALMDRYFATFIRDGLLPPVRTASTRQRGSAQPPSPDQLGREMLAEAGLDARNVSVAASTGDASIISELTAWRAGSSTGLFHVRADDSHFVLKIKPHAAEAIAVGEALADLCNERLGDAYSKWGTALGARHGHVREIALYRDPDQVFRSLLPRLVATRSDADAGIWALLMERVDGTLIDAVDRPGAWRPHVNTVIDDLALLHSRWFHRVDDLRSQPWMDSVRSTAHVVDMTPLWRALAEHAGPTLGSSLERVQHHLIDRIAAWRPYAEAVPQTLIHNDFNPRNICLRRDGRRPRLCAFDWELATIGAPTRDLAELLCFVADATDPGAIHRWIDRHRRAIEHLTDISIDPERWHSAFVAGLCELLIDRLAVYALVHRVKPQAFLPRVLTTWTQLFEICNGHALAD